MAVILIRGTGDVGSAVAHTLFRAAHHVLLHDVPKPAHTRRGMSFTDALFDEEVELAGIRAKRVNRLEDLRHMIECRRAIPVSDSPFASTAWSAQPDVLVDARMQKRRPPEDQRPLAALTVGLGPLFVAGGNVHVAIETAWGERLGAVIRSGPTQKLQGEPTILGGHARDRFVYAPVDGEFHSRLQIGDLLAAGDEVARIGDRSLGAPLVGRLRGLTHDGAWVEAGTKVIEIDPRDDVTPLRGIGERPARIATGVLQAVSDTRLPTDAVTRA